MPKIDKKKYNTNEEQSGKVELRVPSDDNNQAIDLVEKK
jgi:hypothetical protein